MKTKTMRKAFGMGQIMATLLVVLPTMAFIVTFLIDYWNLMQADYRLKLLVNQASQKADNMQDLRATQFSMDDNQLCPNATSLHFGIPTDSNETGRIDITINYLYNGTYLKNKQLSTSMHTYSYHDQNMSITGTCQ
jgi:hypothetical protein